MFVRTLRLSTFLLLAGALTACGGSSDSSDAADAQSSTANATAVTITPGERSPAIAGASAQFTAPIDSAVVDSASVDVTVTVDSFETGIQTQTPRAQNIANSANGQHVHIILDNGPYMANYNTGQPFPIGELSPGAHTLVVFPSRSYHESVKNPGAHDVVTFYVAEETGTPMIEKGAPTIIYSRPKGTYSGAAAEKIMLDFYLHNVELSADGYSAKYTIRKKGSTEPLASQTLTEWVPSFVTGLSSGTYVVHLQLLDAEGNVVPGPFNDTEREIVVEAPSSSM
ncbi:hypothetical protein [Salisaeta longa]|uniref:hypothetical protein n=1 Tax=Salisaeta longa TaxID=503170 RepID=UPI0003B3CAAE|nr:hypothetical protein [Salisaeta longa]